MSLSQLVPWKRGVVRNTAVPFTSLRDEVNRAFDTFFNDDFLTRDVGGPAMAMSPKLDLSETDENVQLTMELPGLTEEDIQVELLENSVKIHGEKKDERETEGVDFHQTERTFGAFERLVPLPAKIDREHVSATFKNGVLSVTMPKLEPQAKHQRIPIAKA